MVACLASFGRIHENGFINFDDPGFIFENRHIQAGFTLESIQWAFSTIENNYWIPVTWLSHILDWNIYQANPAGHHLISLLLHIGAVIFLFLFLNKTTGHIWSAAFAAAFFALHPLRVESVAWASERKDVLSMFFGMATLYTYAFYAENHKASRYFLCLILFTLALMSKPMMVTLPFVLLLLDYWPLHRWQKALSDPLENRLKTVCKIVLEKVPFFLFAIALSLITIWAQKHEGSVASTDILPLATRTGNAIISYTGYLEKIFWPYNLAAFYPYEYSPIIWKMVISLLFLILITTLVFVYIRKLPFLFVGWAWYLGTLIPVIGVIQSGSQAMADRYSYLPSIGIGVILAWGIPLLFQQREMRQKLLVPASVLLIIIVSFLTWKQCGYWKSSTDLFSHALNVTTNNYMAHNNLGLALAYQGQNHEAIQHYNNALELYSPRAAEFLTNRGLAYANLGQHQDAIKDYTQAIQIKPGLAAAYNNRGLSYLKLGHYQPAIQDFNQVIRLKPDYAYAYYFRELAYANLGLQLSSLEDYDKIIRLKPDYADAYNNRGIIYGKQGKHKLAVDNFNKAIRLKPDDAIAYNNRGFSYANLGDYRRAIEDYNKAIHLKPDYTETYVNRGVIYLKNGNNTLGCMDAKKACELRNCKLLEDPMVRKFCR